MSGVVIRSANSRHIETAISALLNLRISHGKAEAQDLPVTGKERHERKRRLLFLHKQRRGYRNWAKFIESAAESFDEIQIEKIIAKQAAKLEK